MSHPFQETNPADRLRATTQRIREASWKIRQSAKVGAAGVLLDELDASVSALGELVTALETHHSTLEEKYPAP